MKKYTPSNTALNVAKVCHESFFNTGMIGSYLLRNRMLEPVNEHLATDINNKNKVNQNSKVTKEEMDYGEYQR
ncbi:MAG: hypothetical protein RR334_02360 [Clostridia bacterium]